MAQVILKSDSAVYSKGFYDDQSFIFKIIAIFWRFVTMELDQVQSVKFSKINYNRNLFINKNSCFPYMGGHTPEK